MLSRKRRTIRCLLVFVSPVLGRGNQVGVLLRIGLPFSKILVQLGVIEMFTLPVSSSQVGSSLALSFAQFLQSAISPGFQFAKGFDGPEHPKCKPYLRLLCRVSMMDITRPLLLHQVKQPQNPAFRTIQLLRHRLQSSLQV
jgi:hypothetical protein